MIRLSLCLATLAVTLTACGKPSSEVAPTAATLPEASDIATPASEPATDHMPVGDIELNFSETTDAYELSADIDPAILAFDPRLAMRLSDKADAALGAFKVETADLRQPDSHTFTMQLNYKARSQASDMISIERTSFSYAGGAHPNTEQGGMVWKKGAEAPMKLSDFVLDAEAFKALMVERLVDEKIVRGYPAEDRERIAGEINDGLRGDSEWADNFLLEPSTETGRFAGISVLFSPYDIGSYAEGPYTVTVEADALTDNLVPGVAGLFGGALPPTGVKP